MMAAAGATAPPPRRPPAWHAAGAARRGLLRMAVDAAAAQGAAAGLTPRQRRLAANKRKFEQQHQQQRPARPAEGRAPSEPADSQQQPPPAADDDPGDPPRGHTAAVSESPPSLPAFAALGAQQQLAWLEGAAPDQLVQLAQVWAAGARDSLGNAANAAEHAALERLRDAALARLPQLGRQQLADVSWGLAHFDALQRHAASASGAPAGGAAGAAASRGGADGMPGGGGPLAGPLQAAMGVPFRVLPCFLGAAAPPLGAFMAEVDLRRDTITLAPGAAPVPEARLTAWQSDIGATFKYSGKEMQPAPGGLTPLVTQARDSLSSATGQVLDSVLVNLYPDGKAGMRFHADPLYGCWTPNTAVVSLGATRRFVFRSVADPATRWHYSVSHGDVVLMFGDCQERLQHAISVEREAGDAGPRMSLVYKQRVRRSDGGWA